jgi:hypothetical protein
MLTFAAEALSYLPPENFFVLAAAADELVVADDMQFSTNGNLNRARLKTVAGARWLTIPVLSKGRSLQKLNEVEIDPARSWQRQHWRTLKLNYHNAPYFGELAEALEELYRRPYQKLAEVSWEFLKFFWKALRGGDLPKRTSELNISSTREKRLAELAKLMHADVYVAHEKYRPVIRPERLCDIQLRFVHWELPPYHQQFGEFASGLNILDLLFNEGVAFTRERVQQLAKSVRAQIGQAALTR